MYSPSADERFDELIAEYFAQSEAGELLSRHDWLARHPEHRTRLERFFDDHAQVERLTAPIRHTLRGARWSAPIDQVGDFRLLRELGRGGMAVVYEAEQGSLGRRVALKVLPWAALLDERKLARFRNEAQAAALLDHPHIVHVYSVGSDRGIHYYAMQLIAGQSMAEWIAELRGPLVGAAERPPNAGSAERSSVTPATVAESSAPRPFDPRHFRWVAELGVQAAGALEYAHQRDIVHRDIKPSNLLVRAGDHLWITDFGLARIAGDHTLTATGDLVGTPRYMSPEQARGARTIDYRSDLYSLGATLYELLALRPACDSEDRGKLLAQVLYEEPTPLRHLDRRIPADLETIVHKCLAKEPSERYVTAADLADDLRRFLDLKPIVARPPTLVDRIAKWSRRHPAVVLSSAITLAVVTVTALVSALLIDRAYRREVAHHQEAKRLQIEADGERAGAQYARYLAEMRQCTHEWDSGRVGRLQQTLLAHLPRAGRPDLRGWEWYYFLSLCHQDSGTLVGHDGPVLTIDWSPSGEHLASGGKDGSIRIWDPLNGESRQLATVPGAAIEDLRWRPNGEQLISTGSDGMARLWHAATGTMAREWQVDPSPASYPHAVAWRPDGSAVALLSPERSVGLYDPDSGQRLSRDLLTGDRLGMYDVAWRPIKEQLATSVFGGVQLWDTTSATPNGLTEYPPRRLLEVRAIDWSADGRLLAAGGYGAEACLWNGDTQNLLHSLPHNGPVDALAFQPRGELLATGTRSQRVELWSTLTGEHFATLRGHTDTVTAVAWKPDGSKVASASRDGTIKLWPPRRSGSSITFSVKEAVGPVAWSPDDRVLACGWSDGSVKLLDADSLEVKGVIAADPDPRDLNQPTWSSDGRYLAWRHSPWGAVWDLRDLSQPAFRVERADVAVWQPSSHVAAIAKGFEAQIWDADRRQQLRIVSDEQTIYCLAWSPDGARLATAGDSGLISIWETQGWTREQSIRVSNIGHWIGALTWSRDSRRLAAGGHDGVITVWEAGTWTETARMAGHAASISKLGWSPDGKRIVSSSTDQTVRLWDSQTGAEVLLLCPTGALHVAWSHDGTRLANAGKGGLGQIWDARAGYDRARRAGP